MYIKRNLCILLGTVLISVILILFAKTCFLFLSKDVDIVITIGVIVSVIILLLSILVLLGPSARYMSGKPAEKLRAFLNRRAEENGVASRSGTDVDEIVEIFGDMQNNLRKMFSSIQAKIQKVDLAVETLIQGIQQVATDQVNLLSISAAIESARPQDGFTQVSSEICGLAERTRRLSTDIHDMAGQLRVFVNETMVELEQVASQIEFDRAGAALDVNAHLHSIREDVEKFSKTVSRISDALKIDPVQAMVSLKQDEAD